MTRTLALLAAAVAAAATLAVRGETLAAFDGRCILAGGVAPPSNIPDILSRRAWPARRLARLGATPDFHHGLLAAADPAHVKEVTEWRAKHEADYTKEYVPLAGLFYLKPGANTAGSAAGSDVLLPKRVPGAVGRFVAADNRIRFEPAQNSPVTIKGKPVSAPIVLKSDSADDYDELAIGDVSFWVHESGARRAIRLRDPQSEMAKSFKGFHWFPVDGQYRVTAKFIKDARPREITMPLLTGDDDHGTTEGTVEFTLNGTRLRMRPITTRPGRLWFIFRDATAGKETYEAARFLYSDLKPDGTTVLDFNEAYNPPCSFNAFTTCPLPLPENRLTIRIPAGELAYAGHP